MKSTLVYVVETLNEEKQETGHCARMLPYRARFDGDDVPAEMLDLADRVEFRPDIIEKLLNIDRAAGRLFVKVQWLGLPDVQDHTWN